MTIHCFESRATKYLNQIILTFMAKATGEISSFEYITSSSSAEKENKIGRGEYLVLIYILLKYKLPYLFLFVI